MSATRLRTLAAERYRRVVRIAAALFVAVAGSGLASVIVSCVSIDPGPNYIVPDQVFNANYFYCFVEPQVIFGGANGGRNCGSGANVPGASGGGCHYSDKVPAMALQQHVPVTCANGIPTDPTQTGAGSPAANNFSAVSNEMDVDWMNAPLYIWPTQIVSAHPVQVFAPTDTKVVQYISTWAQQ
jgi:hypothetical protein